MRMRRATGFPWSVPALVAGCYGSTADQSDGCDAAETTAEADDICTAPASWSVVPVEILSLRTHDDGPPTEGRVVRVEALVDLGGPACRAYGGHDIEVDESARLVRLTIFAWQLDDAMGATCEPDRPVPLVVRIPGRSAGRWTIRDGTAGPGGDPVTLDVEIAPCTVDCWCSRPGAEFGQGQACTQDCQCRPGLDCIGHLGVDGELRLECQPSCTDDRDCRPEETCIDRDDGPSRVCEMTMPVVCHGSTVCPVGEVCPCIGFGCFCTAAEAVEGVACCRTADCPPGHVCLSGVAGERFCGIPCRHDFNCGGAGGNCPALDRRPATCMHWAE